MTSQTLTSATAAKLEADGHGAFSISGRTISFRSEGGHEFKWSCRTNKQASDHLRMFRASVALVARA